MSDTYPNTPDGRYFVVKGRLWRRSNPDLDEVTRAALVQELMAARRAVRQAKTPSEEMAQARKRVDAAKVALGERGAVWWDDGAPDFNRYLAKNTPYAEWFASLDETGRATITSKCHENVKLHSATVHDETR